MCVCVMGGGSPKINALLGPYLLVRFFYCVCSLCRCLCWVEGRGVTALLGAHQQVNSLLRVSYSGCVDKTTGARWRRWGAYTVTVCGDWCESVGGEGGQALLLLASLTTSFYRDATTYLILQGAPRFDYPYHPN